MWVLLRLQHLSWCCAAAEPLYVCLECRAVLVNICPMSQLLNLVRCSAIYANVLRRALLCNPCSYVESCWTLHACALMSQLQGCHQMMQACRSASIHTTSGCPFGQQLLLLATSKSGDTALLSCSSYKNVYIQLSSCALS